MSRPSCPEIITPVPGGILLELKSLVGDARTLVKVDGKELPPNTTGQYCWLTTVRQVTHAALQVYQAEAQQGKEEWVLLIEQSVAFPPALDRVYDAKAIKAINTTINHAVESASSKLRAKTRALSCLMVQDIDTNLTLTHTTAKPGKGNKKKGQPKKEEEKGLDTCGYIYPVYAVNANEALGLHHGLLMPLGGATHGMCSDWVVWTVQKMLGKTLFRRVIEVRMWLCVVGGYEDYVGELSSELREAWAQFGPSIKQALSSDGLFCDGLEKEDCRHDSLLDTRHNGREQSSAFLQQWQVLCGVRLLLACCGVVGDDVSKVLAWAGGDSSSVDPQLWHALSRSDVWCNRLVIVTANAHTCLAVQPHSYVGQVLQAMLDGDDSPAAFLNPQEVVEMYEPAPNLKGVRALPVLSPEAMAELVRVPTAAHDLTIPTPTKMALSVSPASNTRPSNITTTKEEKHTTASTNQVDTPKALATSPVAVKSSNNTNNENNLIKEDGKASAATTPSPSTSLKAPTKGGKRKTKQSNKPARLTDEEEDAVLAAAIAQVSGGKANNMDVDKKEEEEEDRKEAPVVEAPQPTQVCEAIAAGGVGGRERTEEEKEQRRLNKKLRRKASKQAPQQLEQGVCGGGVRVMEGEARDLAVSPLPTTTTAIQQPQVVVCMKEGGSETGTIVVPSHIDTPALTTDAALSNGSSIKEEGCGSSELVTQASAACVPVPPKDQHATTAVNTQVVTVTGAGEVSSDVTSTTPTSDVVSDTTARVAKSFVRQAINSAKTRVIIQTIEAPTPPTTTPEPSPQEEEKGWWARVCGAVCDVLGKAKKCVQSVSTHTVLVCGSAYAYWASHGTNATMVALARAVSCLW